MRERTGSSGGLSSERPATPSGESAQVAPFGHAAEDADVLLATRRRAQALTWLRALAAGPVPAICAVKLCGLTCEADVDAAVAAGADLLGFVCDVPSSRRSVTPARLAELCAHVRWAASGRDRPGAAASPALLTVSPRSAAPALQPPHPPWCVGVFVDEPPERLAEILASGAGPDLVQLHGHEDAAYIERLCARLAQAGCEQVGIIQAFHVRGAADVARANASLADLVLLDAGAGCGEAFDWSLARLCTRAFVLAGGLGPGNLAQAVRQVRPWGVDMSSGVETQGVKDSDKMAAAVHAVRAAGKEE